MITMMGPYKRGDYMATISEKRASVAAKYRTIIGRNVYSQNLRDYCYRKYSNGKYYSDCSSSICYTYKECGYSFGILNTVGMWNSSKLTDVDVVIKNGIIQNPSVLRVGDMLLFAGTNSGRKSAGYVGHVEMVGEISGNTIMLYGHGSGNPKRHEMNAYCKSRYNTKTSKTSLGHTGLIRVRRYFVGTGTDDKDTFTVLHNGSIGTAVVEMQEALMSLGYDLPMWGADGEFGDETELALRKFQADRGLTMNGVYDAATDAALQTAIGAYAAAKVRVTGSTVNIRNKADVTGKILGVVHRNDLLAYGGEHVGTWFRVNYNDSPDCWISAKYSEIVKDGA